MVSVLTLLLCRTHCNFREENVLSIDPKTRHARLILDPIMNLKWMKMMDDVRDIVVEPSHDKLTVPYAQFRLPHLFKSVDIPQYYFTALPPA